MSAFQATAFQQTAFQAIPIVIFVPTGIGNRTPEVADISKPIMAMAGGPLSKGATGSIGARKNRAFTTGRRSAFKNRG